MKKIKYPLITAALVLLLSLTLAGAEGMESFFPQMEGWSPKGKIDQYDPDNLFEYINGAAEVYLSFDFRKLASQSFQNKDKKSFTVDIYRHSSSRNGFGIYSQEKPQKGDFLRIGAQGYYEKGVLNFLKGIYYVKLSGYDLGDNDKAVLEAAARQVADKLEGENVFPKAVLSFPTTGKIENSERFVAQNFLGHSFLSTAFVAEYEEAGGKFQLFIIQTGDDAAAKKMLDGYLNFVKGKGMPVETPGNGNFYRFQDPYYRSSGAMNMKQDANFVWGLFSKTPERAEKYINEIHKKLKEQKLVK